jgi:hypothetical protein
MDGHLHGDGLLVSRDGALCVAVRSESRGGDCEQADLLDVWFHDVGYFIGMVGFSWG